MIRLLTALFSLLAASLRATEKPNLIFILCDDLAQGDLGSYGHCHIRANRELQLEDQKPLPGRR